MSELEQVAPDNENVSDAENEYGKGGLIFFGVVQILLGALCLLAVIGMIAAQFAPARPEMMASKPPPTAMIPGVVLYLGIATWLVWMGVGSIWARRWARTLILVAAWVLLMSGIHALVTMQMFMPELSGQTIGGKTITPAMASGMNWMFYGTISIFMFLIPGVLLLYYSRRHVREIVEYRDPQARWTDKAPLPVLVLCGFLLTVVLSLVTLGYTGWVIPLFGVIIDGFSGAMAATLSALLALYAVRKLYSLERIGWRLVFALTLFWSVSMMVTFLQVGPAEYFNAVKTPPWQIEQAPWIKESMKMNEAGLMLNFAVTALLFLGYTVYLKKYFKVNSSAGTQDIA